MSQKFNLDQAMQKARVNMVQGQLQTNRVTEPRLIEAFMTIPREIFTLPSDASTAYLDRDCEVGGNRYLLEPLHLAWLLEAAAITPQDRVLEVASNSGYGLAIAAKLGRLVVGVESDDRLIEQSRAALHSLQLKAEVVKGVVTAGMANLAPYDVIIIAAGVDEVPQKLFDQLANGGRLVTISTKNGRGKGMVFHKVKNSIINETILFEADKPILPEMTKKAEFVF